MRAAATSPPVFSSVLAADPGPAVLWHRGFARAAEPFLACGLLEAIDVHTVDLLARRAGVGADAAEALLGLAFAVRAPRHGGVGIDLATARARLEERATAASADGGAGPLDWPSPDTWRSSVEALTQLVGEADRADGTPFVFEGPLLLTRRYALYQRELAARLLSRARAAPLSASKHTRELVDDLLARLFPAPESAAPDAQRLAVALATFRSLSVICGGPGTGKTHTVRALLRVLRTVFRSEHGRDPDVALAAPTGKAAVRMLEALREGAARGDCEDDAFLAALMPTTIHALLRRDPAHPSRFRHGEARPLRADVVIVDEASMIDLALMCKLAAAVRPEARFVLLGDPHQLASVECGSVLRDLTESSDADESPLAGGIVRLSTSYRTRPGSSLTALVTAIAEDTKASLIRARALFAPAESEQDLRHYPHADSKLSEAAEREMLAAHAAVQDAVRSGDPPTGALAALDLLDGFRVLTPHRHGALGVRGLDDLASRRLRPASARGELFVGMPILIRENRTDLHLANGDLGVCTEGLDGRLSVAFRGPTSADEVRFFSPALLPRCEPSFALTVHKSQGSQYRTVLLVLPRGPSPALTRELVYTAATRARERLLVAGSLDLFCTALAVRIDRASSLRELLQRSL